MRPVVLALAWLIRLLAVVQLVLGLLFWAGNAYSFVQLHMLSGVLLVLGVWVQAVLALRAGLRPAVPGVAIVWGVLVVGLGVTQTSLLPGDLHWLIRLLHLLVGLAAVAMAEIMARGIRGRPSPAAPRSAPLTGRA